MPRVFPKNKNLMKRKDFVNQKRHVDLSEDDKEKVAKCRGEKHNHECKNPVYVCLECGNYGCDQDVVEVCTEQGLKNDKCLNCGVVGNNVPIMEEDFDDHREEWEREVPETK